MSLNVAEIRNLLRRAHLSARRGYQIALGDEYAQKLAGTDGSPKGLIELCQRALEGNAEPVAAPAVDDGPPTWAPPAPVAPSVPAESVELAVPVEPKVEAPAAEEPAPVEAEPPTEVEVELPVDVTAEATADESTEDGAEEEGEAEEPVEAESADVAKDPAPSAGKRSKRRRGK